MIESNEDGSKTTPGKIAKEVVLAHLKNLNWEDWDHIFSNNLTEREVILVSKQVETLVERLAKKLQP
jgi:hypothetical protein